VVGRLMGLFGDLAEKGSFPANQRTVRIASDASPPRGALFKRGAAGSALSRRALTLLVNRRLPSVVDVGARRAGRTSWRDDPDLRTLLARLTVTAD
jgi:hypothetical protein